VADLVNPSYDTLGLMAHLFLHVTLLFVVFVVLSFARPSLLLPVPFFFLFEFCK